MSSHRAGAHRGRPPRRRRRLVLVWVVAGAAVSSVSWAGLQVHDRLASHEESGTRSQTPASLATTGDLPSESPADAKVAPTATPSTQRLPRPVPAAGPGTFVTSAPHLAARGAAGATDLRYTVEIEENLALDPDQIATRIADTLRDARGWTTALNATFAHVKRRPDFRILIATPRTTDALCAPLQTRGRVSCRNQDLVVLNAVRWTKGIPDYQGALAQYQRYLVNHEVGHALGQAHQQCPASGEPAPVMQQQTYGLNGCRRNVWPVVA